MAPEEKASLIALVHSSPLLRKQVLAQLNLPKSTAVRSKSDRDSAVATLWKSDRLVNTAIMSRPPASIHKRRVAVNADGGDLA